MPAPALRIPLKLSMDEFERQMNQARNTTAQATRFIVTKFIDMNASVLATAGATGTAVLGFRSLLGVIAPVGLALAGVVETFRLMSYMTTLAKERIEEFNAIAEKAAKTGLSPETFQRLTKAGEQLKRGVDEVTGALERFKSASAERLGGSDIERRLKELRDAGNFAGNKGVAAFAAADDTNDKMRAFVQLIDEAMQKGERLAAIDLAQTAFGRDTADVLRQDSGYLDQLLRTAEKIREQEIISQEEIGRAIDLKNRMEEAEKVLSEKFKPIQEDLARLGTNYHESWVGITQKLAEAVEYANSFYQMLKNVPDWFARVIGNASIWSSLTAGAELPKGLTESTEAIDAATQKLAAALRNRAEMLRAMGNTSRNAFAVRGDSSRDPNAGGESPEEKSAFEREIERLKRTTALRLADAFAVGQTAEQHDRLRAELVMLEALERDGVKITAEQLIKYAELRQTMGALDAARAAGIPLTAKLGEEFVKSGNAAFAASRMTRQATEVFRGFNDTVRMFGDQMVNVLDGVLSGTQSWEQGMASALRSLQRELLNAALTGQGAFAKMLGFAPDVAGGTGGLFGWLAGLFKTPVGANAGGTDNWRGGLTWVGERGPELVNLPRGAQVIPNDILRAGGGGGASVVIHQNVTFHNADPGSEARIRIGMAEMKRQAVQEALAAVAAKKSNTPGWLS